MKVKEWERKKEQRIIYLCPWEGGIKVKIENNKVLSSPSNNGHHHEQWKTSLETAFKINSKGKVNEQREAILKKSSKSIH